LLAQWVSDADERSRNGWVAAEAPPRGLDQHSPFDEQSADRRWRRLCS
jgi:hypothetical protein